MICYSPRLPALAVGGHEIDSYSVAWVRQVIQRAAAEAGHSQWVFAQDIASGVIEYLREKFSAPVISLPELHRKMSLTLEAVGFPDIAARLRLVPPPVEVSLAALAREANLGGELVFFHLLGERLREAAASGAESVRLTGLGRCVEILERGAAARPCQRRGRSRVAHRDEILAFVSFRASAQHGLGYTVG